MLHSASWLAFKTMDHKAWLWRKKSSEKTILAIDKVDSRLRTEQIQANTTEKGVATERSAKNLNEKLASVLLDCHVKEDVSTKIAKTAGEATAAQDKAEKETELLKQEQDEALKQEAVAANEKLALSEAALKECRQQLSLAREEQEQRIHDAVTVTSREYEKAQKLLEEKLAQASNRLVSLTVENSNLSNAFVVKDKVIEELQRRKSQADAEFCALMTRLDSTEKENAFLKYEFHMLEKELEIRNVEMEYYRRSADESQKQQLESVSRITKLEQECERLRLLVRKRSPGPPLLVNMKSEAQMMGRNRTDMRRRKVDPTKDLIVREPTLENSPDIQSKKMSFMIDKLREVEEENKALKEVLNRKSTDIHSSRFQLGDISKGQKSIELGRYSPLANKLALSSGFDAGSDDGLSSSGSWATALLSELENFRNGKSKDSPDGKALEVSDISLMDDFVEMEKLAIVTADISSGNGYLPNLNGKDLVPVAEVIGDKKKEKPQEDIATNKSFDWLQVVLNAMLEQKRVSKRSLEELLEEIKIALGCIKHPIADGAVTTATLGNLAEESDPVHVSGCIAWKSPNGSTILDSLSGALSTVTSVEVSGREHGPSDLSKSIAKIIKLVEGINQASLSSDYTPDDGSEMDQNSASFADYFIRVFQWKRLELDTLLQQFLSACNNLLNGNANLENFVEEVASALDWILNNYVTPNAASRDKIKKHFGWNELQRENDQGVNIPPRESDMVRSTEEQSLCLPLAAYNEGQDLLIQLDKVRRTLQEENGKLIDELTNIESEKKDMEARLQSATEKSESLMIQLQELEQRNGSLQTELETLKASKGIIEDQIEDQKLINEDLDTQLTVSRAKLNEVFQKFSSLEVELEDKRSCLEELEATCLELQLQLESLSDARKETPKYGTNQEEKQSRPSWEITTASAKLAECQETILNLGKQLKALASPREAAILDKMLATPPISTGDKKLNKRSSLRDRMLAEDDAKKALVLKPPKLEETTSSVVHAQKPPLLLPCSDNAIVIHAPNAALRSPEACHGSDCKTSNNNSLGSLAIVPSKKQGAFGLLKRLLFRKKKGSSHKFRSLSKA
ncbi:filament-like plant protein 7 isoform X1 [Ziziphus jujuba]|uniref:Filament-like plant protein 7 isoform X1 n=1 Tax=Ziziphus jujuba TaxID=326968 RepID=A0A6P6GFH2_ZIZJJ|nr:filament-like plant protein 7 isoform X1 [Ziziphus jujuba]